MVAPRKSYDVEIAPGEQPRLFTFVHQLCDELGATRPEKLYVNFEANAYVTQQLSAWRLIVPAGKSLVIGLGCVNCLSLGELKALLAHEVGHLAQRNSIALRLAIALTMVDGILHRRAHGRLLPLRRRIAAFCHRQLRHTEREADRLAVRATGSETLVQMLEATARGARCLDEARRNLEMASRHGLHTDDIFYHQSAAALSLPQEEPRAERCCTHPPDEERVQPARRWGMESLVDARSAWFLFDQCDELRRAVTRRFYRSCVRTPRDIVFTPAKEVQRWIEAQRGDSAVFGNFPPWHDVEPITCSNRFATGEAIDSSRGPDKIR